MTSSLDFSDRDLRGRSFRGGELNGANFEGTDLRGADFTGASLVGADFTKARFGMRPIASATLLGAALLVSALAGLATAFFMQSLRERLYQGSDWQDGLASVIMLTVIAIFIAILVTKGASFALPSLPALIAVAFVLDVTIVIFFGEVRLGRAPLAIALMLLAGLAFVAGILGRMVGGAFGAWAIGLMSIAGGLVAGRVEGGFAATLVAVLLVVMSKRTLKGDDRDRMLRDLTHRIVTRHGTRFTRADISRATFVGTNLVAADMTGSVDEGTIWGPGQVPHRLDPRTRSFGRERADADDDVQGDRPIIEFLFGAANTEDYADAPDLVTEDFAAYVNGHKLGRGDGAASLGPELLTNILSYHHKDVEDSFWQLYDEVDGGTGHDTGDGVHQIAIRFVASGTFDGDHKEIEVAGFIKIKDKKMTEMRFVTDLAAFNEIREAAGLDTIG